MSSTPELFTLFGVYFIGLGLNLTPCVYPMLSVTASIFARRTDTQLSLAFFKALVYVLGIVCMYTILGVLAALGGGVFGEWLQNKWVLILIATCIFIFALAMFGVWRIEAPGWLINKLGSKSTLGWLGLFLSGLFVGIIAAPCIGPPVAALLTHVASKADPVYGSKIFFVMAMGLGTPYLILGTFSHLLSRLPKSGAWMIWVERVFGCILLTISAYYYLVALYPKGIHYLLPIATLVSSVYLGFFQRSGDEKRFFYLLKRIAAVVIIIVMVPLYRPTGATQVEWQNYTPPTFESALSNGKPMLLDFYADWCIPCHEMDQTTYRNSEVIQLLNDFDRIKVDLTDGDDVATKAMARKYLIIGMPTTVFIDSEGKEIKDARAIGYVSASNMIQILTSIKSNSYKENQ
ncbi:MAG: thiol:disulfide interchange protein DsbD [Candidatus Omnitrophota bacterium]|jgi:thiol:disulfide interchange protein DsbD